MLNAYWEPLTFELPAVPDDGQHAWRRCIDTALRVTGRHALVGSTRRASPRATYVVQPRSIVRARRSRCPKIERSHGKLTSRHDADRRRSP